MTRFALFYGTVLLVSLAACSKEQPLGGSCDDDDGCDQGLICLRDLPGGVCSQTCDDGECPEGAACIDLAGDQYCLTTCEDNADCRDGYACSLGHCDLPCADDDECPAYALCDPESLGCEVRLNQPLGGVCRSDEQCTSGLCHQESELDGICLELCGGQELCDGGMVCGALWEDGAPVPRCMPPAGTRVAGDLCGGGADCASGICAHGACVYPCSHGGACDNAGECVVSDADIEGQPATIEICQPTVASGVRTLDFGTIPTERGVVQVEFDAPEDIASFAVVAWTDEPVLLQPRNLIGPGGQELIGNNGTGLIRVYDSEWVSTILVPNTDREGARPIPGRYSLEIHAHEVEGELLTDADVHLRVLFKVREGGTSDGGELVLNIHIAPHVYGPLSASNARESPYIRDILDRVRFFYGDGCNVPLIDVRYFDLDADYSLIGSDEELREMFQEVSPGTPRATANVFVVRDLSGVAEWLAGISGGIPGPPGVLGTIRSGVAVSAQERAEDAGDVLAHELGHFLGLFHPTEMNGRSQDPIEDTEICEFDPDDYWDMVGCETSHNIMFPMLTTFANEITEGQCLVVRSYQGV
jgi:hypothetical protein